MLFESESEQNYVYSQNSIQPLSLDDIDTSTTVSTATATVDYNIYDYPAKLIKAMGCNKTVDVNEMLSKHMIWALKNQQFNFDKFCENELIIQVPLPLFYADEPLFCGVGRNITIKLTTDPQYATNLIQIAGSPSAFGGNTFAISTLNPYSFGYHSATGANFAVNTGITGGLPNTINVAVTDMKLYVQMAHIAESSVPRGIYTIYMKQFSPFLRNLGTGNNNSFTVDLKQYRRMSHIAIAFINLTNETFHMSPTDLSSVFTAYSGNPSTLQAVETNNINDQLSNLY